MTTQEKLIQRKLRVRPRPLLDMLVLNLPLNYAEERGFPHRPAVSARLVRSGGALPVAFETMTISAGFSP